MRRTMEAEQGKGIKVNLFQVSMNLGTKLGLYIIIMYAVMALSVKYSILSLVSLPLFLGVPVMAFLLVRHFRVASKLPFFPFPVSWMITLLTFVFSTVLSCMAVYLYLRFIDHGALSSALMERMDLYMTTAQSASQTIVDQAQIDQYNASIEMFYNTIKWFCSLSASGMTKQLIQSSLLWGNILSIIIAIITTKRIRLER